LHKILQKLHATGPLTGGKLANFSLKFEFFQLVKGLLHKIFGNLVKQALSLAHFALNQN